MTPLIALVRLIFIVVLHVMAQAAGSKYLVEVCFIADDQVVKNYNNLGYNTTVGETIRGDIMFTIDQVNTYLESLKVYDLDIQITNKQLFIQNLPSGTLAAFNSDQMIKGSRANYQLIPKLKNSVKSLRLKGCDVVVILTGHSLSKYGKEEGLSSKTMCMDISLAIIKFQGIQKSAQRLAYQLAHNLRATDGCKSHDARDIMTEYDNNKRNSSTTQMNQWLFSNCTSDEIKGFIEEMNDNDVNCLEMRDIMQPDNICKRFLGDKDASFCDRAECYKPNPLTDDLKCDHIACQDKNKTIHKTSLIEGMVCNSEKGKRCKQGKCE